MFLLLMIFTFVAGVFTDQYLMYVASGLFAIASAIEMAAARYFKKED